MKKNFVCLWAREHGNLDLTNGQFANQSDELVEAHLVFHPETVELRLDISENANELLGAVDRVNIGELGAGTSRQQIQRVDWLASHWFFGNQIFQDELETCHITARLNRTLKVGILLKTVANQARCESRHGAKSFEFRCCWLFRSAADCFNVTLATEWEEAHAVAKEKTRSHVRNDRRENTTEKTGSSEWKHAKTAEAHAAEELCICACNQTGADYNKCREFHFFFFVKLNKCLLWLA